MTQRSRLSLDGAWQFWTDPTASLTPDTLPEAERRPLVVPAPWQAQGADLRYYSGVGWYHRTFEIPEQETDVRLWLGFGAVDYFAEVWLNGERLGSHEGGYLPFEWDVTALARQGENTLYVRVSDPEALFAEIPHGKQSWYGPLSGIWQSVWLERRGACSIRHVRLLPELHSGTLQVHLSLAGADGAAGMRLKATLLDPDDAAVARVEQALTPSAETIALTMQASDPRPWSPDAPHLYRLALQLWRDDGLCDEYDESFGFRTIEARAGQLFLNGEPLFLRGALDQDYYPDTIATPPSLAFLEDQAHKAKALGLNCLRCHIKVPDPRYYEVADRLGLLVWTELPNWHTLTARSCPPGPRDAPGHPRARREPPVHHRLDHRE